MSSASSPDRWFQSQISARDAKHLNPDERAELVNSFIFHALALESPEEVIEHPLYWDLLCYNFEMLLLYAQSSGDDTLFTMMRKVNNYLHAQYYSLPPDAPQLGPSRDDHKALWIKRIEEYL